MLAMAVWWPSVLHGRTETGIEGTDTTCKGFGDRLFEGTGKGMSRRGKEEDSVEGADEGCEGQDGGLSETDNGKEDNVESHRVELGPHRHPSASQVRGQPDIPFGFCEGRGIRSVAT